MIKRRRRYRRGYPLAVLVGLGTRRAVLWRVFSEVVKLDASVQRGGEEEGSLYGFHESIVNALRLPLKEGVRSIVIAAPARTDYAKRFLDHIRRHHRWLMREGPTAATFGELTGSAGELHEVRELVRTEAFRNAICETTSRDAENIAEILERSLHSDYSGMVVLYSLKEIEDLVYGRREKGDLRPEHVILTNTYLKETMNQRRIQKLLQISKNVGVMATIVNARTRTGTRLTQFGGLVCLAKADRD